MQLRITTWNVLNEAFENKEYYHTDAHPFLHWQQGRREAVCQYAKRLNADVYCLQEVSQTMAADILKALDETCYTLVWEPRTKDDGCATIYDKRAVSLVRRFGWRYASGKHIFLATLFECGGTKERFWTVNTHVNWKTREDDLLALQRQLNEHPDFSADGKLVMGDFNAEASETWYQALAQNQLIDAKQGHDWPWSYNSGKNAKWIDFVLLHRLPLERLQSLCVGELFKAMDFTVRALPSATVPSDHAPVNLTLWFQ